MFQEGPDQRLYVAIQRRGELIYEAEQNRLAGAARRDRPRRSLTASLTKAIRANLGRAFGGVRGLLSNNEVPCGEPCPGQAGEA
jgi:hypothetical protein